MFEMLGLYDDAMIQYDELDALFSQLCHTPTYQISFTYLERQKGYGPDKLCWEEAEEAEKKSD
jgi:hypothetical protein